MCPTCKQLKRTLSANFVPLYTLTSQLKVAQEKEKPIRTGMCTKEKKQLISAIKIGSKQKRIGVGSNFIFKYSVQFHNSIFTDHFEEMLHRETYFKKLLFKKKKSCKIFP